MAIRQYTVEYRMFSADKVNTITVYAGNMIEAYDTAFYVTIPARENETPYSAWVESVHYNNGKTKRFNTFEGKPY